jgi:DDE superfamily endonuclease
VPQCQKSRGSLILTAALELSGNQVTHFYSANKNTTEMIRMMELLVEQYRDRRKVYLSWDAASWHISKRLFEHVEVLNAVAASVMSRK